MNIKKPSILQLFAIIEGLSAIKNLNLPRKKKKKAIRALILKNTEKEVYLQVERT